MKVLIIALLLVSVVVSHSGPKGRSLEKQWDMAMKDDKEAMLNADNWYNAVATHMAAQRKFHTSEFKIYDSRREYLTKQDKAYEQTGSCMEKYQRVVQLRNEEIKAEKEIVKVTNANKAARDKPMDEKWDAWGVLLKTPRRLAEEHQHPTCSDSCCKAFYKYYDARDESIKLQLKFHNKEFAEFDNEDACVQKFKANIKEGMKFWDVIEAQTACMNAGNMTQKEILAANKARVVGEKKVVKFLKKFWKTARNSRGKIRRLSLLD